MAFQKAWSSQNQLMHISPALTHDTQTHMYTHAHFIIVTIRHCITAIDHNTSHAQHKAHASHEPNPKPNHSCCQPPQSTLQLDLPSTLVFDYPTVSAISSYVCNLGIDAGVTSDQQLPGDDYDVAASASAAPLPRGVAGAGSAQVVAGIRQVAVAAFACRTAAGNAVLSLEGRDAAARVPFERWSTADVAEVRGDVIRWFQCHPCQQLN